MERDSYTIFAFDCGGFFYGRHEFRIDEVDGEYIASLESMPGSDDDFSCKLSDYELRGFKVFMDEIGVNEWFCHYNNWGMLDGTQWGMQRLGAPPVSGSNAFPKGFSAFTRYLANHFGCECFRSGDDADEELTEGWEYPYANPLAHIAEYADYVCDPVSDSRRLREGHVTAEELEEEQAGYESVWHQMLHDIDVLVGLEPKFTDYMNLVKQAGVPDGSEAMREFDISGLDADTIVAMVIYIYRADRWCGYQEHFLNYVKDGTFKRWLDRLNTLLGNPIGRY